MNALDVEKQIKILLSNIEAFNSCDIFVRPLGFKLININNTELIIEAKPSLYDITKISDETLSLLVEANLKQSEVMNLSSALYILREQYLENILFGSLNLKEIIVISSYNKRDFIIKNFKNKINEYLDSISEITTCEVDIQPLTIRFNKVNNSNFNIDEISLFRSRSDREVDVNNSLLIESGLKQSQVNEILNKQEELFSIVMPDNSVLIKGPFGVYREFIDYLKMNGSCIKYTYKKGEK